MVAPRWDPDHGPMQRVLPFQPPLASRLSYQGASPQRPQCLLAPYSCQFLRTFSRPRMQNQQGPQDSAIWRLPRGLKV